jgi:23S rRNA (guanosine2251-2'-O)-methyltransferase
MRLSKQLLGCYGWHAVQALLKAKPEAVCNVYLVSEMVDKHVCLQQVLAVAHAKHIKVCYVSRSEMDALLGSSRHQGVYVEYTLSTLMTADALCASVGPSTLLLVLDGVQDPHNLGACLRTAWAAGAQAVIAPKDRSVGLTTTVHQVACGAAACVPYLQVTNLATFLRRIKALGVWVYGAKEAGSQGIYDIGLTGPTALVLGSEGSGLRALTERQCDGLFYIPTQADFSTLNVSVATGICLFEARRQRLASEGAPNP